MQSEEKKKSFTFKSLIGTTRYFHRVNNGAKLNLDAGALLLCVRAHNEHTKFAQTFRVRHRAYEFNRNVRHGMKKKIGVAILDVGI